MKKKKDVEIVLKTAAYDSLLQWHFALPFPQLFALNWPLTI